MSTATLEKPTPTITATTPVTPAPAPAAPAKKKVSFAKAPKKEESSKTSYPVFDDQAMQAQVCAIAARIKLRTDELTALEGAQDTDKAELRTLVSPFYYKVNARKVDAPSSISVPSQEGEVLVTYQNRYSTKLDEAAIIDAIGQETYDKHFHQTFTLTVAGDKLPVGDEQAIVDEVTAVLEKYHALEALQIKDGIAPNKDFHARRLLEFTPEQNLRLDQVCPVIAMIKTKGREGK